jgi:hypothetical protein
LVLSQYSVYCISPGRWIIIIIVVVVVVVVIMVSVEQ